jgi:type IV secretory pathway VirD2 relaxase
MGQELNELHDQECAEISQTYSWNKHDDRWTLHAVQHRPNAGKTSRELKFHPLL